MFHACLIANRGEIAVRIIQACRELGIRSVAVYSDADRDALHVRLADSAYPLGGVKPSESYLRTDKLIEIAHTAGCDCVHPGYGFLSENEDFAQAVIDAGLAWVGPSPDTIQKMGVKTEARSLMQVAGVPLVPGFQPDADTLLTDDLWIQEARRIGYPLMVKAAGGGGGKGIRIVYKEEDLLSALSAAQREAQNAFNDARVFLEKYIEHARHIEVQVIGDQHGQVLHLFERECSAQRRHQKVIEETPAPHLTDEQRQRITQAGVLAAQAVNYHNAGTVEFIATQDGEFYFLEMNTRLQVEHPVTEWVTGIDLVQWQFKVAYGERLPLTQAQISQRGHAIEVRLYAEDPENQFLPSVGTLVCFETPLGAGVRVDTGVTTGDAISLHYDPMIAKISVYAPDRPTAIQRLLGALERTVVLGLKTNLEFLQTLLKNAVFAEGKLDTGFIDRELEALTQSRPPSEWAWIVAALEFATRTGDGDHNHASSSTPASHDIWDKTDAFRLGGR